MSTHMYKHAALVLLALGTVATPALAQTAPGAVPAAAQAAQAPAAPAVTWDRSVTGSVSWLSSTYSQTTISLSGEATRSSEHWVHAIAGDETFASVKSGDTSTTVADSQALRYMGRYMRTPTARVYYIVRPSYKRNATQAVDYRFEELFGVGFQVTKSDRFNLDVIPAAGGVQQKKNIEAVDGNHFAAGIYQNASGTLVEKMVNGRLDQSWSWSQFLLYLAQPGGSDDYRLQFSAQLQGTIIPRLSLTVGYNFDKENIVLEGTQENDQRVTVGLRVAF